MLSILAVAGNQGCRNSKDGRRSSEHEKVREALLSKNILGAKFRNDGFPGSFMDSKGVIKNF